MRLTPSNRYGIHSFRQVSIDDESPESLKNPSRLTASGPKDEEHTQTACPYCKQAIPHHADSFGVLGGGFRQLLSSIVTLGFGVIRLARFIVASALSILGFIGACSQSLAVRIAHKNDRPHLDRF